MNISLLYISKFITIFINYIILSVYTIRFGTDVAGYLTIAITISSIIAIADFGIFTAVYRDLNDSNISVKIKEAIVNFILSCGLIIFAISLFFIFYNTIMLGKDLLILHNIIIFSVIFFFYQFLVSCCIAVELYILSALLNISFNISRLLIPIMFIDDYEHFDLFFIINSIIAFLCIVLLIIALQRKLKISYSLNSIKRVKVYLYENFLNFFKLSLFTISATYVMNLDKVAFSISSDITTLGVYGILFYSASMVYHISLPLQMYFQPRLVRLLNNLKDYSKEFENFMTLLIFLLSTSTIVLALHGPAIIETFFKINIDAQLNYYYALCVACFFQGLGTLIHVFAVTHRDFEFGSLYFKFCIINFAVLIGFISFTDDIYYVAYYWSITVVFSNVIYLIFLIYKQQHKILLRLLIPNKVLVFSLSFFIAVFFTFTMNFEDKLNFINVLIFDILIALIIFSFLIFTINKNFSRSSREDL